MRTLPPPAPSPPDQMRCGLLYSQLLAMVDFILEKFQDSRTNCKSEFSTLLFYLTSPPYTKSEGNWSWSKFQDEVKAFSSDGARLLQFFKRKHFEMTSNNDGDIGGGGGQGGTGEGTVKGTGVQGGGGVSKISKGKTAGSSSGVDEGKGKRVQQHLREDPVEQSVQAKVRKRSIDVFGSNTYQIKDALKARGFSWDGSEGRNCWYKVFASTGEKEGILGELRALVQEYGFELVLSEE